MATKKLTKPKAEKKSKAEQTRQLREARAAAQETAKKAEARAAKNASKKTREKKPKAEKKKKADKDAVHFKPIDPSLPKAEQQAQAAMRIASAAKLVEEVEGDLSKSRREWAEIVAKRKVALKASIEATSKDPAKKLNAILSSHQAVEEAEAGRKVALADLLDRKKKARSALRLSFDGARQMDLPFDRSMEQDGVPAIDEEETPESLAREDDDALAREAKGAADQSAVPPVPEI